MNGLCHPSWMNVKPMRPDCTVQPGLATNCLEADITLMFFEETGHPITQATWDGRNSCSIIQKNLPTVTKICYKYTTNSHNSNTFHYSLLESSWSYKSSTFAVSLDLNQSLPVASSSTTSTPTPASASHTTSCPIWYTFKCSVNKLVLWTTGSATLFWCIVVRTIGRIRRTFPSV